MTSSNQLKQVVSPQGDKTHPREQVLYVIQYLDKGNLYWMRDTKYRAVFDLWSANLNLQDASRETDRKWRIVEYNLNEVKPNSSHK